MALERRDVGCRQFPESACASNLPLAAVLRDRQRQAVIFIWRVIMVAAALRNENAIGLEPPTPSRSEALARYRHLREISQRHNSGAASLVSKDALLFQARRLGLAHGRTFVLDSMDELTLALDLAVYT